MKVMQMIMKDAIIAFLKRATFLKLTNDIAFKAFFKKSKKLLIAVLNHFLPLEKGEMITGAELVDTHHPPEKLKGMIEDPGKQLLLDLKAKIETSLPSGQKEIRTAHVEMQTTSEPYFLNRNLAYSCRVYVDQVKKGGSYSDLSQVYSLSFCTENLKIFKGISDYYHICNIRRTKPPDVVMSDGLCFVIVELGKFDKSLEDLYNEREFWCYLLKHANSMSPQDATSFMEKGGAMAEKAVHHLWDLSQDEILREYSRAIEKKEMDERSREEWLRKESLEKGWQKGQQEGRQEVALNLLKTTDMDIEAISKATGLSKQDILNLKNLANKER